MSIIQLKEDGIEAFFVKVLKNKLFSFRLARIGSTSPDVPTREPPAFRSSG